MNKKKLVKVVKNFITDNEIDELNQWTLSKYNEPYFVNPRMNNDESQTRFTTRHSYGRCKEYQDYKVQYPKEVYDIQKKLLNYLKIKDKKTIELTKKSKNKLYQIYDIDYQNFSYTKDTKQLFSYQ